MIFRKLGRETNYDNDESTEIWIADFGHDDELHQELYNEVLKLKPKTETNISWILISIFLLFFIIVTEIALRQLGLKLFWSEQFIFWATWLWRLVLVIVWLLIARLKWLLATDKMFITSIISFVTAIIILGVMKIVYVRSAWAWLNLFVEPIWMILLIALLGSLFIKITKSTTGGINQ